MYNGILVFVAVIALASMAYFFTMLQEPTAKQYAEYSFGIVANK